MSTSETPDSEQSDVDEPLEWASDERIQSPHDRLINQTLQQIDAARTLLAKHLPREVAEHLELHTLTPVDTIRVYVMSVNPIVGEEKMNELVSEFWPVQPEPGSVADQLIKKGEARGEARGESRGEARGEARASANTIRILQSILCLPESPEEELADKSLEELKAKIESLRKQISKRPPE